MNKLEPERRAPIFPVVLEAQEDLPSQVCEMRKSLVRLDTSLWCQAQCRHLPAVASHPGTAPTGDGAGPSSPESTHNTVQQRRTVWNTNPRQQGPQTSCLQAFRRPVSTPLQGQMGTCSLLTALAIWEILTPGFWGQLLIRGDLAGLWISVPLNYEEEETHSTAPAITFAAGVHTVSCS